MSGDEVNEGGESPPETVNPGAPAQRRMSKNPRGSVQAMVPALQYYLTRCQELLAANPQEASRLLEAISKELQRFQKAYVRPVRIEQHHSVVKMGVQPALLALRDLACRRLGQYQRLIEEFDEAIRVNSQDCYTHYARGNEDLEKGKYRSAIEEYDEVLRLNPHLGEVRRDQENSYHTLGVTKETTERDGEFGVKPQYGDAYFKRGLAHRELGLHQRAVEDFNESIRLNPQDAQAHALRAEVYTLLGEDGKAIRDVKRAVELGYDRSLLRAEVEQLKQQHTTRDLDADGRGTKPVSTDLWQDEL